MPFQTPPPSCPLVSSAPALSSCVGRNSDCWSVGQPDVDCVGAALCCFDGCANVCQGAGGHVSLVTPMRSPKVSHSKWSNTKWVISSGSPEVGAT